MRVDPYNSKRAYERWMQQHESGVPGLSPENSTVIRAFLVDMERGVNIAKGSRKGGRSHVRLNTLRTRLVFLARLFHVRLGVARLADLTEDHVHRLVSGDAVG